MFHSFNKKNLYIALFIIGFSLPFFVFSAIKKDIGISNAVLIGEFTFYTLWLLSLTFYSSKLLGELFFIRAQTATQLFLSPKEAKFFLEKNMPEHASYFIQKIRDLWDKKNLFEEEVLTTKGQYFILSGHYFEIRPFIKIQNITQERKAHNHLQNKYNMLKNQLRYAQELVESIPLPIWQYSAQNQLLYGNEYYKILTGKQKEMLLSPEDLAKGDFPRIQKIIQADCQEIWRFDQTINPGNKIYFGQNISRETSLELKLKDSQKIQADFLDHMDISMAIYGPDTRIKHYNQTYLKIWGLTPKFLQNKPRLGEVIDYLYSKKMLPEFGALGHFKKERLDLFKKLINQQEGILYLPDGRIFRTLIIPHIDGNLLFMHENISEFYNLKCKIHNLEQMNQTILGELKEAILIFGENGRIQYFNKALHDFYPFSIIDFKLEEHISTLKEKFKIAKIPEKIEKIIHRYAVSPPEDAPHIPLNDSIKLTGHYLPDGSVLNRFSHISSSEIQASH